LKHQVNIAHRIATNIYNKNKNTLLKNEIIKMIKEAIEDIRFNEERGYFSIHTIEGINILHPINPKFEGTSVLNRKDFSGNYPVQEMINIAKIKGEGFSSWYYFKPNDKSREFKKIGVVKNFEPYNLIITTAEYVDDYINNLKSNILNNLSKLRYKDNRFIFIIDNQGKIILHKSKKALNHNIFEEKGFAHVKDFFKKLLEKENKEAGDFLINKPIVTLGTDTKEKKVTYAKKLDELEWIVATSFKLSDVNKIIEQRKKILEEKYDRYKKDVLLYGIILTIILIVLSLIISKLIGKKFLELRKKELEQLKKRLLAKDELLNAKEKFNNFFELSINLQLIATTDGTIIQISNTSENILGYTKEELIDTSFVSLLHPDDLEPTIKEMSKLSKGEYVYSFENRYKHKNGNYINLVWSATTDNNNTLIYASAQNITESKKSEILLHKSEEKYKSLMQQAPYAIEIFDKNGLQIDANKAHEKLWNYPTRKMLGTFNILTDEKFKDSGILPYIKRAYSGEIVDIPPHKFSPVDSMTISNGLGRERVIKSNIYPLKDDEGNIQNIIVTQIDVSHEEESKKRDSILTSVFQVLPDLLFIMKKDGIIIDYRAQKNSNLYVDPKVFLGNKIQDVLPEKIANIFNMHIKDLKKNANFSIFKYELEVKGNLKHFEARMAKLPGEENIMTIVRDITDQVSYEQQLTFQLSLLEQSLSAIDVVDENALFYYVNSTYVKMWGYDSKEEVLGTSPLSHCMDSEMPKIIIEKVEKNKEHVFQFKGRKKNGDSFDVLMAVKYVHLMGKKFYIASSMDISENEKMKKESIAKERILYQQSKMASMGEMLGNIAHQWRQPLSTISTASTGAKIQKEMDSLSDDELDSILTIINDSAQYLSTTIDDFRNFFNPKNNNIHKINSIKTIEKALKLVSSQFNAKDIELIQDLESYEFLSIENELVQVLVNLLNNAKDILITKENLRRLIFINTYQKDGTSYIEIKDNGGGVDDSIVDRIFEPYFTTKHQAQGTGIGLYMSEEIVKNHLNGILSVENSTYTYDGIEYKGAKFSIKIDAN
tara:strand:+ start:3060 stop:6221 length:3162 start_codon:yes stop_codon:yes gene_type:complete